MGRREAALSDERPLDPVICWTSTGIFARLVCDTGLSPSSVRVYCYCYLLCSSVLQSLGRNLLVTHFLRGTQRLRPLVRPRMPLWDLAVVLEALSKAPFEHLDKVSLIFLTLKTIKPSPLRELVTLRSFVVALLCLKFR